MLFSSDNCSKPLTPFFIDKLRITNQRFSSRRSRFDNTFKGNGLPVQKKWFSGTVSVTSFIFDRNIFTSKIRRWTQVWAWGYFLGRQLVVCCHIPREDRIQLSITNYRLGVFRDIYWGGEELTWMSVYVSMVYIYWPTSKPKCRTVWVPHIRIELSIL